MTDAKGIRRPAALPWSLPAVVAAALGLAACGSADAPEGEPDQPADRAPTAMAASPDLAACPGSEFDAEELRQRTEPIPVPASLSEVMRSNMDNFAVATLGGKSVCVDASWMESIENARLGRNGRFLEFDWWGYEAFGHVLIDRAGAGQVIDTGVPPAPSPSGDRIAALDYSESGYGALNALGVWEIAPDRVREIAKVETLPDGYGWRLDRWAGEACLDLSAVRWEDLPDDWRLHDQAPRQSYFARADGARWQVRAGRCPAA